MDLIVCCRITTRTGLPRSHICEVVAVNDGRRLARLRVVQILDRSGRRRSDRCGRQRKLRGGRKLFAAKTAPFI